MKFTSINVSGLKESKNFENKVTRLINGYLSENGMDKVNEIHISDAGIRRAGGYGQYELFVNMLLDSHEFNLRSHTTNSMRFDDINSGENENVVSNLLKRLVLDVIEEKIDRISDDLYHESIFD